MSMKVAINGFGRIGRPTFKIAFDNPNMDVVAINDLSENRIMANLLKYDTVYGKYDKRVEFSENYLIVDGKEIKTFSEMDPVKLPWKNLDVDIVLECTGVFVKKEGAEKHLKAGAKKVIISAPPKGEGVPTYIIGVNEEKYDPKEDIISGSSCTTNCYAPLTKVLHDNFEIERGFMVTAHASTNDQRVIDAPHDDLRRARSASVNIIPTTSGSDKSTGDVIPEIKGKLHAMAMRVPIQVGSVIYAIYDLKKKPQKGEVNEIVKKAAEGNMKDIIKYSEDEIVSSDVIGTTESCIFDSLLTDDRDDLIKVVAWYDNEWACSKRYIELTELVGEKL